ncbi:hypothetical protein KJB35_17915 [Vibrio sp. D431a]|nr:hypothetical protein [Vibrio sp. D431a]
MDLKELASQYHGKYDPSVANLYLTFRRPKSDGGKVQHTVTARVPKKSEPTKFKTRTQSAYNLETEEELKRFLDSVREGRDAVFASEHEVGFSVESTSSLKVKDYPRNSTTGVGGMVASRNDYQFKVSYTVNGETQYKSFPLVNYGSEDAAYIEAAKFSSRSKGEKVKTNEQYLSQKRGVIFPDFASEDWELKNVRLKEIKQNAVVTKSGIEVSAEMRLLGFYANYFTELKSGGRKGQRRKSFNALLLGEKEAFLRACRAKDEIDGKEILTDEEYLKMKEGFIFEGLTPP